MPLIYPTLTELVLGPRAVTVHCTSVDIRMPIVGEGTISYRFEAVDANGKLVTDRTVTVLLSDMRAAKPDIFAQVYAALKTDAYERIQKVYPTGTVI